MTDIYFEVASEETTNFHSPKQSKTFYKQEAWMHLAHQPHPVLVSLFLGDKDEPYAKGNYITDSKSYYADKFGSPAFNPKLVPMKAAKAA